VTRREQFGRTIGSFEVRKAPAPPIYGGTNEIQREIISRSQGL
jgi:hypothetical protein